MSTMNMNATKAANSTNLPTIANTAKPTPRKRTGTTKPLSIEAAIEKAGIIIDKSADAATIARENLRKGGAEFVPDTANSDKVVILSDTIRANINVAENGVKNACLLLAVIDETEEYKNALNAKKKPYNSTLELARDLFPRLEKSTVANYITAGRSVYLPAARGMFGKASGALLAQSPSNATIFAGYVGDSDKGKATKALSVIQETYDKNNGKITAKAARTIVKELKAGEIKGKAGGIVANSDKAMDAAKQEYNAMAETDAYNSILKKMLEYVPQSLKDKSNGDITITIPESHVADLSGIIAKAMTSDDVNDKNRVLKALRKVIFG